MHKKKKIELIAFLTSTNENIRKRESCIFYDDYTIEYKTYQEGQEELVKLLQQENVTDINDLLTNQKLKFYNKEDFLKEYEDEILHRKNCNDYVKNSEIKKKKSKIKDKSKVSKFSKIDKFLKISILILTSSIIGSATAVYSILFEDTTIDKSLDDDLKNTNSEIKNSDKIISIFNNNKINTKKRIFTNATYNYLYNYNNSFATKYIEKNSNVRAALKWDEVVAQQLIFNNYNKEDLGNIFDYYDYNANTMYKAYIDSIKQETMANIIQKTSLEKTDILDKKSEEFYQKYEMLNIKFNIQTNNKNKIKVAEEFFKELRKDINFDEANNIKTYKTSILSIVNAMMIKCNGVKINGILSKKETNWFYNTCLEIANKKLNDNDKKIESAAIINKALGEKFEISFENIEDIAMKALEEEHLYNVSDSERNLKYYKSYDEAKLKSKNKAKKINKNEDFDSILKVNYDDVKDIDTGTEIEKETEKKQNNNSKKNKKKINEKESIKNNNKNYNSNNDDNNSNNNSSDNNDNSNNPDSNYDDSKEYDNYDESKEEQDNYSEIENDNNENSSNMPKNNEIKDITDDSTGAVDHNEPLPDPNLYSSTNNISSTIKEQFKTYNMNEIGNNNSFVKKIKYK